MALIGLQVLAIVAAVLAILVARAIQGRENRRAAAPATFVGGA